MQKLTSIVAVVMLMAAMGCSLVAQSPESESETAAQSSNQPVRVTPGETFNSGGVVTLPDGAVTEPAPVYFDVIQAYDENRLEDARALAAQQLTVLSADLAAAGNDTERESLSGRALGLIIEVTAKENTLSASDRLGGDVAFFDSMKGVLAQVSDVTENISQAPDAVKDFLRGQTGRAAGGLIESGEALVPMEDLEQVFADFQIEIAGIGYDSLEELLASEPLVATNSNVQPLTQDDISQIRDLGQQYFDALLNGDVELLESVPGIDADSAQSMLEALEQDFEEEGVTSVNSIAIPDEGAIDVLLNSNGLYTVAIQGIAIEVVMPDSSTASTTISKRFTMSKESDGTWRIEAPQQ